MLIQDGKGRGARADVNKDNQLLVEAVTLSAFAKAARNGDAYSWTAVTANIDTAENMLSVINQSRSRLLNITKIYGWIDAPGIIQIHLPAPGSWTGTAVVGVNMNRSSLKTADAEAWADETGDTFAAGNVIWTWHNNETTGDEFGVTEDFDGSIILGYDDCVACYTVSELGAFNCTIQGYYTDIE